MAEREKGRTMKKDLMRVRVFALKGNQYVLKGTKKTLERYLVEQLQEGYALRDMTSYGVKRVRCVTERNVELAKKQLDPEAAVLKGQKPIQEV